MDNRETDNPVDIGKVILAVSEVFARVGYGSQNVVDHGDGVFQLAVKRTDSSDKSRGAYNA